MKLTQIFITITLTHLLTPKSKTPNRSLNNYDYSSMDSSVQKTDINQVLASHPLSSSMYGMGMGYSNLMMNPMFNPMMMNPYMMGYGLMGGMMNGFGGMMPGMMGMGMMPGATMGMHPFMGWNSNGYYGHGQDGHGDMGHGGQDMGGHRALISNQGVESNQGVSLGNVNGQGNSLENTTI